MSANISTTLEVIFKGTGAQQLASDMKNVGTASAQTEGMVTKTKAAVDNMSQSSTTLGGKLRTLGAGIKDNALAFSAAAAGIIGLVENYTSLQKAQLLAQRSAVMLEKAHRTLTSAQTKLEDVQHKSGATAQEMAKATNDVKIAQDALAVAEERNRLNQERLNEASANFATQILPNIVMAGGGVVTLVQKLGGSFKGLGGGISGLGSLLGSLPSRFAGVGSGAAGSAAGLTSFSGAAVTAKAAAIGLVGPLGQVAALFGGFLLGTHIQQTTPELQKFTDNIDKGAVSAANALGPFGDLLNAYRELMIKTFPQFASESEKASVATDKNNESTTKLGNTIKWITPPMQTLLQAMTQPSFGPSVFLNAAQDVNQLKTAFEALYRDPGMMLFNKWMNNPNPTAVTKIAPIPQFNAPPLDTSEWFAGAFGKDSTAFRDQATKIWGDISAAAKKSADESKKAWEQVKTQILDGLTMMLDAWHKAHPGKLLPQEKDTNKATAAFNKMISSMTEKLNDPSGFMNFAENFVSKNVPKMSQAGQKLFAPLSQWVKAHAAKDTPEAFEQGFIAKLKELAPNLAVLFPKLWEKAPQAAAQAGTAASQAFINQFKTPAFTNAIGDISSYLKGGGKGGPATFTVQPQTQQKLMQTAVPSHQVEIIPTLNVNTANAAIDTLVKKVQGITKPPPIVTIINSKALQATGVIAQNINKLSTVRPTLVVQNSKALQAVGVIAKHIADLANISPVITVRYRYVNAPSGGGVSGGHGAGHQAGYHGYVNQPTLVMLGERGREKLDVTPGHSAGSGHGNGSSNRPIHIHVHSTLNVDGKKMAEVVSEHIDNGIGGYTG